MAWLGDVIGKVPVPMHLTNVWIWHLVQTTDAKARPQCPYISDVFWCPYFSSTLFWIWHPVLTTGAKALPHLSLRLWCISIWNFQVSLAQLRSPDAIAPALLVSLRYAGAFALQHVRWEANLISWYGSSGASILALQQCLCAWATNTLALLKCPCAHRYPIFYKKRHSMPFLTPSPPFLSPKPFLLLSRHLHELPKLPRPSSKLWISSLLFLSPSLVCTFSPLFFFLLGLFVCCMRCVLLFACCRLLV